MPISGLARRRSNRGFSLIEMLVALTLVGVAMAMTIPRIGAATNQAKVHRAAQTLQQDVQQAYAIAARNRAPVTIRWDTATMQLRTGNLSGSTIYRRTGYGTGGSYGLTSSELTFSRAVLTVFPNGLANDTLAVSVKRNAYSRAFWVSRSGMVLPR